jgi:CRP-like cAMP-binding protein
VARILREVHVPAGHVFWRRSDPARQAIRVVSGAVRCTDEAGQSVVVGSDYMLGTIAAAAQRSYGYEARADTDVSAYEISFEDWLVVLEAHPELAMRLLSTLAMMLAQALRIDRASRA